MMLFGAGGAFAGSVTASQLMAEITRDGAVVVVNRLAAGSGASWANVLTHIESGQDAWLGVARALRSGVDAGTGEDLTTAVATALRGNPAGVLKMTDSGFPIAQVCDVPLIEPTGAQVQHWKHDVLSALARVHDAGLSEKVQQCRAAISTVH